LSEGEQNSANTPLTDFESAASVSSSFDRQILKWPVFVSSFRADYGRLARAAINGGCESSLDPGLI